jgi:hypothetical protein
MEGKHHVLGQFAQDQEVHGHRQKDVSVAKERVSSWFITTGRYALGRSGSSDSRFFAVIKEQNGTPYLTWGKNGKAASCDVRFRVDKIVATWTGKEPPTPDQPVMPAFKLILPTDIGAGAKARRAKEGMKGDKKAAKVNAKAAKKAARAAKKSEQAAAKAAAEAEASEAAVSAAMQLGGMGDEDPPPATDVAQAADAPEPEPEPAAAAAEEGVPPPGDDAEDGEDEDDEEEDDDGYVEINPASMKPPDQLNLYRFVQALQEAGAVVEGGASKELTEGGHHLTVLQDGDQSTGVEFTLDQDNCIKDFKGSLLKAKGISIGPKLDMINDVRARTRHHIYDVASHVMCCMCVCVCSGGGGDPKRPPAGCVLRCGRRRWSPLR